MPTGTPYNGHIPPYPRIRIDMFSTPRDVPDYREADLLLLTHTHSDHVQGLSAKSFGLPLFCSVNARSMLLNFETAAERVKDDGRAHERPFQHLEDVLYTASDRTGHRISRKLLNTLELNKPTLLDAGMDESNDKVLVTAIDANHCPGSVMYLIEGNQGAVLHTGDIRCEPSFIEALKKHPLLLPYIRPRDDKGKGKGKGKEGDSPNKQLEAIYLDTACMLFRPELPSKESAVDGLVNLIDLYPTHYKFFINTWTPGYEELLVGIARAFNTKIHVDKYKMRQLTSLTDQPIYKHILTTDPTASRFHACERFDRCSEVADVREATPSKIDDFVVYVNPNDMGLTRWQLYVHEMTSRIQSGGALPLSLRVALSRHSSLPELKALVGLFRPKTIVPNTVYPHLEGRDWAAIPFLFKDELPPEAADRIWDAMRANGVGEHLVTEDFAPSLLSDDVEEVMEEGDGHIEEQLRNAQKLNFSVMLKETGAGVGLDGKLEALYEKLFDLIMVQKVGIMDGQDDGESTDEEKGLGSLESESQEPAPPPLPCKRVTPDRPTAPQLPPTPPSEPRLPPTPPSESISPVEPKGFLFTIRNPSGDSDDVPLTQATVDVVVAASSGKDDGGLLPVHNAADASRAFSVSNVPTKERVPLPAVSIAELLGVSRVSPAPRRPLPRRVEMVPPPPGRLAGKVSSVEEEVMLQGPSTSSNDVPAAVVRRPSHDSEGEGDLEPLVMKRRKHDNSGGGGGGRRSPRKSIDLRTPHPSQLVSHKSSAKSIERRIAAELALRQPKVYVPSVQHVVKHVRRREEERERKRRRGED